MELKREAELLAIIETQKGAIESLTGLLKDSHQRNKLLEQKIEHLVRRVFGSSSEKLDPDQLKLKLDLEEALGKPGASGRAESSISEAKKKAERKERKPRLPEHLPVEEERIEPLEVQADPSKWKQIGEEVTVQLDYRPAQYIQKKIIRPKYVPTADKSKAPVIAPLPAMLPERCLATAAMLAHVVVGKYASHLPLYRQEQILKERHGLEISRQTLDGWVMQVAEAVRLIYESIRTTVMDGGYLQVDETPIRFLEPGFGRTRQGYFWTMSRPGFGTVYQWHPGRGQQCLEAMLADYRGVIQCDGYAAYGAFARERPVQVAACWAHARRKFFEAKDQDRRMGWMLHQIGNLYRIEEMLRLMKAGPRLREAVRQAQSRPILNRIKRTLDLWQTKRRFLPQSGQGQAVDYTLNLWKELQVFVKDGRIEIDNNIVENAIRPTAIGKKNWLFIGAKEAGQASAVLFTLVQECKRVGLNPETYLAEVLRRLPTATTLTVHELTPQAMSGRRQPGRVQDQQAA
jgi:transposase